MTLFWTILELIVLVMLLSINLSLAIRFLSTKEFFPYHEEASQLKWIDVDSKLKLVILAILRVGGMGFIALALSQALACVFLFLDTLKNLVYIMLSLNFIYWIGIFFITYKVHRTTGANTPWKNSIMTLLFILIGFIVLFLKK